MGAIVVHLSRTAPPRRETARSMLAAAPHRGNQQEVETLGQVVLGVTNHAGWVTATISQSDGWLAALCGALDNEAELRAELREDVDPATIEGTPASTLLAAYLCWGESAVSRMRGSFAAAITDGRHLSCFRDHLGTRPLFYHDGPDGFHAATEVKQVLAALSGPREPNLEHLHLVLFGGMEFSTAFKGVERLPKSAIVNVGSRPGVSFHPYWDPDQLVETNRLSLPDAVEGTVEALKRAVHRQLTGHDVLLLSGGLDSPSLGVFAAKSPSIGNPVQALTALYPEYPSVDEKEWTEMAADHLGMPLHSFVADAGSMDDVEHWVKLLDGPVDILSIPESAEAYTEARRLGGRNVLNGEVAEFLFHCPGFLLDHLLSHGRFRAAGRVLGWWRDQGRTSKQIARDTVLSVAPNWFRRAYGRWRHRPQPLRGVAPWVDEQRLRAVGSNRVSRPVGARHRWRRLQTAPLSGPGIGFEADEICASVCGVDTRRPFADVDLWEFVLSLPAEVKYPSPRTKPLLREAMRGLLPDELIDRSDKTVFNEFHEAKADYPKLRSILIGSPHRLDGVDYSLLEDRLRAADMPAREIQWARDLARIHVFLDQW